MSAALSSSSYKSAGMLFQKQGVASNAFTRPSDKLWARVSGDTRRELVSTVIELRRLDNQPHNRELKHIRAATIRARTWPTALAYQPRREQVALPCPHRGGVPTCGAHEQGTPGASAEDAKMVSRAAAEGPPVSGAAVGTCRGIATGRKRAPGGR